MAKALVVSNLGRHFKLFGHSDYEVLQQMGVEVHIAANFNGKLDDFKSDTVVQHQVDFERSPFSLKNIRASIQMRNLIRENNYDLIHCHSPSGGVVTRIGARLANFKPIIYTAHGFHFYKGAPLKHFNILYYLIEWLMARWSDGIITINNEDFMAAKKMPIRNKNKTFIIPSIGVDINKYSVNNKEKRKQTQFQLGLSEEDFVVTVVAELTKKKNHKQILNALKLLNDKRIKLLVIGTGIMLEELKEKVNKDNLVSQVQFLGYRRDIPELLNASDVTVLTSLNEGFGMCLLESMASGLPIVSTKTKGAKEAVIENYNGYLVDINDSIRLSEALTSLKKNNKEMCRIMGERSRGRVNEFSIDQTKKIMLNIYDEYLEC